MSVFSIQKYTSPNFASPICARHDIYNNPFAIARYKIQDTRYFIVLLCIQLYTYKTKYTKT